VNQKEALETFQGKHNQRLEDSIKRLEKGRAYEDLSTIWLTPTRGSIPAAVLPSWFQVQVPMNQPLVRIFVENQEVGEAYNSTVESILKDPALSKFRFLLCCEDDNIPPPDGLLKLYESIRDFDAVGGLYWTKGEGGQPMIYGSPDESPINFRPQVPIPETIQRCNGLGQGWTLMRLSMLRDPSIKRPLFRTAPGSTQDLAFFREAGKRGYRFACDTRVRVGHYDRQSGVIW
jgi:hypothetical protein